MSTLILSGWTQPSDALAAIEPDAEHFDYSEYASPEASFLQLEKFKHATHIVSWSLGGQLALRAIAEGILAPEHLTLLGTPYQFVSGEGVTGMDPLTFEQFRANYASNPARTKTRFHGLVAKGDRDFSRVLAELVHHDAVEDTARWLPWLDTLRSYSLRGVTLAHLPRTLIIHGMNDAIVPPAQAQLLAEKLTQATVNFWEDAGHAPHLHDAPRLRAEIAAHREGK